MDRADGTGDTTGTRETMIEPLRQRYLELWWGANGAPPAGQTYLPAEQQRREGELDSFLAAVRAEARAGAAKGSQEALRQRLTAAFGRFAREALDFDDGDLHTVLSGGLTEAIGEFAGQARAFDPGISDADIFQAGRNVLSMAYMQLLWGLPVELTPAMTAYSLLYPYSDNYLDDPTVPAATKAAFNCRFRSRLEGTVAAAENAQERAIFALVDLIGTQYGRDGYRQVHESLLAIHTAQERSVRLLRADASPYEVDVLGLAIEKGGASVLADAYLVKPTLSAGEVDFAFGLGVLLQLGDDLQDVESDRRAGLQTVFSQTAGRWPLDAVTDRTLLVGEAVMQKAEAYGGAAAMAARSLMGRSARRLVVEAAGQAPRCFTARYLGELERQSPFRFAGLRRRQRTVDRLRASLLALVQRLTP